MASAVTIVGARGEIGRRFVAAASTLDLAVRAVTRTDGAEHVPAPAGTPIVVCVREDDLPAVLARIPPDRGCDLVVVQNGFIDERVEPYPGLTRAVLWFTAKGTFFADLLPSPVFGSRAELVRRWIHAIGASAEVISDRNVFLRAALEKAIWTCVVGAPLAVWGIDLATARHERMAEIEAIVREACDVVAAERDVQIAPARVLAVLDDTSNTLGWMRGGTKGFAWRNGKVVEWGKRRGIATPANGAIARALRDPGTR